MKHVQTLKGPPYGRGLIKSFGGDSEELWFCVIGHRVRSMDSVLQEWSNLFVHNFCVLQKRKSETSQKHVYETKMDYLQMKLKIYMILAMV